MQQTFQCYRCGAQNYSGILSCWHCGTTFTWQQQSPPVYQQPINYQQKSPSFNQPQPDKMSIYYEAQPIKNWAQRHINWTYWIIGAGVSLFVIGVALFAGPHLNGENAIYYSILIVLACILLFIVEIGAIVWLLKQKGQSLWHLSWLIIPMIIGYILSRNSMAYYAGLIAPIIYLCLRNKRDRE